MCAPSKHWRRDLLCHASTQSNLTILERAKERMYCENLHAEAVFFSLYFLPRMDLFSKK